MTRPRPVLFFLFILVCFHSKAQPYVDLLNLKYQYYPEVNYKNERGNKLTSSQSEAAFLLPLEQKNKSVVLIGGDYTRLDFSVSGNLKAKAHLQSNSLLIGYELGLKNKKWRCAAVFIPKVNAGFNEIKSSNIQAGGVVLFKYEKKETLGYHFGLYYNREYFGDYFIPLLGIEWKLNDRLNIFGELPANMNLEWKLSKSFYSGAEYSSFNSSFRAGITTPEEDYIREGDKFFGHNELHLYLNAYVTPNIVAYGAAGFTVFRQFQQYDSAHEKSFTDLVYQKAEDGLVLQLGLAYRVRLDAETKNSSH